MDEHNKPRREFLSAATRLFGAGWLASHSSLIWAAAETAQQALAAQSGFALLSADEALTLAALADQIFPPDETPGASELGAVYFMDAALGGFMTGALPMIQQGIVELDQLAGDPGAFHQLAFDQQTPLVKQLENSPFFGTVHFMTLCGLFAAPSYGGNRQGQAWKLIGFESRHVWQHPFGYYDAHYQGEADHASS